MHIRRKLALGLTLLAIIAVGIATISYSHGDPATTQPDVVISPQAHELLDQVRDAYASLKTLGISGTIEGHFDIDGVQNEKSGQFKGLYSSTGLFRSEMTEKTGNPPSTQPDTDAMLCNTGDKIYFYLPSRNRFVVVDSPKGKVTLDSLGDDVADVLRNQDLALALAISGDAGNELAQDATSIQRVDDVKIDGQTYPAIQVLHPRFDLTLAIDPQTHFIRRTVADLSKNAKLMGAQTVKNALLTTDFVHTPFVPAEATQFAWAPPPGAQPLVADQSDAAGAAMEGKPVPAFTFEDMSGKQISSESLKGSVYVLDLWATWCGPCVASLPHLDQIYKDYQAKGVKFFAIDQQESKSEVEKFVSDTKLSIPVLMDPDGKTSSTLNPTPDGEIPFTLVIGKDGKVIKVQAGYADGIDDQLRPIIDSALKQ